MGPYKVKTELRNDRYIVEKLGECEGPNRTSTSVDHMKLWPKQRGMDLDVGGLMGDNIESYTKSPDGIEVDATCRMAECGNEESFAVGNTENKKKRA